ncbi:heterokaryon incompatibility protein-domain-containing protein [Xylaria venustula]|nr:heterokaryon incompatibility protein-domain-containing protein [Xylaria venustula]
MRLINTTTLELEDCLETIPKYAILSHTWGDEEVTLHDWMRPGTRDHLLSLLSALENEEVSARLGDQPSLAHSDEGEIRPEYQHWYTLVGPDQRLNGFGYWKILKTCLEARKDGLNYLWVDTNCIDKTSSADLSEAINSMYTWYRSSSICYAYLSDVRITDTIYHARSPDTAHVEMELKNNDLDSFRQSRWFRRGWTLQELLAPKTVRFYSRDWTPIGTKKEMATLLAKITRVDAKYLLYAQDIRSASIAQRMAAVADRTTTRPEDIAYCLLGLFNVNMPLLYGEGAMAFVRLQEEIMKVSDDHSLFYWTWISELTGRFKGEAVASRRDHFTLDHKPNFPVNRVKSLLHNRMRRDGSRPTLLAPDPACFFDASSVPTLRPLEGSGIFTLTNAGLSVTLPILRYPDKRLFFAVIDEVKNPKNDTISTILIPLTPHYRHQDRWTRTSFPVAPITVVFQNRNTLMPRPQTIQVCRDIQHVSFYFDSFGGSSHRFGFWLLYPQHLEWGYYKYNLEGGCILGDGVYNNYGVFVDPDKDLGDQFIGGLLTIRLHDSSWNGECDKFVVLFLVLGVERMPDGHFKKTSQHCKILFLPKIPVDAPKLLEEYVVYIQKHLNDNGQSTHRGTDTFKEKSKNIKRVLQQGHVEGTLHAEVELMNDEYLSHSPQSEITLTKLSLGHSEKRSRDLKKLGRFFTI